MQRPLRAFDFVPSRGRGHKREESSATSLRGGVAMSQTACIASSKSRRNDDSDIEMAMAKTALITGVSGQDGAYLARRLLQDGYRVVGAYRRSASNNLWRLDELGVAEHVELVPFELLEFGNIQRAIERVQPDEVYNLAAQSYVGTSFEQPLYTADVDAMGVMRLLEAIRVVNPTIRFFQASTSEMFGKVRSSPQNEETPFYPRSPYGVAKLFAHWSAVNYRESFGMHACSGIAFNHESPLRGEEFVTRKVTRALARIRSGKQSHLELGNLDARRDWGFADDYVDGMVRMLRAPEASDFVLATGETHSVRELVEVAARWFGFELTWRGEGVEEVGIEGRSDRVLVRINPTYFRPAEVDVLCGDASRARSALGWSPKTSFVELVEMMCHADARRVARG